MVPKILGAGAPKMDHVRMIALFAKFNKKITTLFGHYIYGVVMHK